MSIEPDETADELRAAFERVAPEGPFAWSTDGVEVEVDLDGDLVDVVFDERAYRAAGPAELGAAVVAAHRAARESALAAHHQALLDVLAEIGADPGPA